MTDSRRSLGRYPTLQEVMDYYLRDDIAQTLFELARTRHTSLKWRVGNAGRTHSKEVAARTPDELKKLVENSLARLAPDTLFSRYPHFEGSAARYRPEAKRPFAYDFLFESDGFSLRDNFHKLDRILGILESYHLPYLAKFSGRISLHIVIPGEAFPESIEGKSTVDVWPMVDSRIASYLRVFGKTEIDHEPTGTLPYSLSRKTGLVSLPLDREQLEGFQPWMANVNNVETVRRLPGMDPRTSPERARRAARFLEDVLAWHPPKMKAGQPRKGSAEKSDGRVLRPSRTGVDSRLLRSSIVLLRSTDQRDRIRAAWNLLWQCDAGKVRSVIQEFLDDPSPDVRYFLISLVAKIGPESLPRNLKEDLVGSCRDPHEALALEDLLVLDTKDGFDVLLSSLSRKDNRWNVQIEASALRRMKLSEDLLHRLLAAGDIGTKIAAAIALGRLGYPSSVPALEARLDDPCREVRLAAISSLGLIGEPSCIGTLSRALGQQAVSVRRKAIQALSRIDHPEALHIICSNVSGGAVEVRREALRVLDGRPDQEALQALLAGVADRHALVRVTALRVLSHSEREVWEEVVEEGLRDQDETVRVEAKNLQRRYQDRQSPLHWPLNNI